MSNVTVLPSGVLHVGLQSSQGEVIFMMHVSTAQNQDLTVMGFGLVGQKDYRTVSDDSER
jgi:hypothetical protein